MMSPQATAWTPTFYWPLHCGIILGASAFLLSVAVKKVRTVALRQATGQLDTFGRTRQKQSKSQGPASERRAGRIRRINSSPTIWRELRTPMFRGRRTTALIVVSIAVIVLLISYLLFAEDHALDEPEVQGLYIFILGGLGLLFTIVLPATCITSEKESRSWPLLLATTLSDWQILFGKFVGVLRRCLPIWSFMFGHLLLFVVVGYIHPIALIQLPILVAWLIVFLVGTGLFFGSWFKRTTTAVIMNFALAAVIWGLVPLLMILFTEVTHSSHDYVESYMNFNPAVQEVIVLQATCGSYQAQRTARELRYYWVGGGRAYSADSTAFMFVSMLIYMLAGFFLAWRAKCGFRHNIF
jgi:ABC-type transport system involved in multi-copper enzyme maturation permease subunit